MCNKQDGFTFIEAVVSLLIIALISAAIYATFATAYKALNTTQKSLIATSNVLIIDAKLRDSLSLVCIPFWVRNVHYSSTDTSITIPWVKGVESKSVTVSLENYKIENGHIDIIKGVNEIPLGCHILYTIENKEYMTSIVFASIPLGQMSL